jgi:hypothetical protein
LPRNAKELAIAVFRWWQSPGVGDIITTAFKIPIDIRLFTMDRWTWRFWDDLGICSLQMLAAMVIQIGIGKSWAIFLPTHWNASLLTQPLHQAGDWDYAVVAYQEGIRYLVPR